MQPVDHVVACALCGDAEGLRARLAAEPRLLRARTMFGIEVAHAAHFGGHDELLAELERAGLEIDAYLAAELGDVARLRAALHDDPALATSYNTAGSTALHGAAYFGQRAAAELLISGGADADACTRDPFLQIPVLGSAVATTPGIPQPSDDENVVLELVRMLLEAGAQVDRPRRDGMTALHAAAWRGLTRVVQELLDAGADPAHPATDGAHAGETAADSALSQGHLLLAVALDTGAEPANPYG